MDSEHNAIYQALGGRPIDEVERIVITASGGPFRTWSAERMAAATPADALKHPNWSMGRKITIDSATLMNKGLEVIEAHHLFGAPPDKLEVLVHPQSVIHGHGRLPRRRDDGRDGRARHAHADRPLPVVAADRRRSAAGGWTLPNSAA